MVTLLPFGPEQFAELTGWFASECDPVQWGGPAVTFPLDKGQLTRMLADCTSSPPARLCWMAQATGRIVGHAQIVFDWRNGNATLARIGIAPSARGRRLARPMLVPVVRNAFRFPEIERVELNVYSFNTPALRTYESLGFKKEGVRRASARVGAERWDTVGMAILRAEWAGERPAADSE